MRKEKWTAQKRLAQALVHGGIVAACLYFECAWAAAGWAMFTVTYCLDEISHDDAER